jgi:hypothetical protein
VDDAVAARLQSPQQRRQHGGGLRLGVVQQHDAAPDLGDAGEEELQLGLRRHRQPVAGPDIGAEHDDAAGLHPVEQRLARGKTGKAEERRGRLAPRLAISRQFVTGDAAIDLGLGLVQRQVVEQRMRIGVMAERMAFRQSPPGDLRMCVDIAAEQEEGGADAFRLQGVEHPRRGCRPGAVVEGQHQFLVAQRQGVGEVLAADPGGASGIDGQHPFGAERIVIARTRLRRCGRRKKAGDQREDEKSNHDDAQAATIDRNRDGRQGRFIDAVKRLVSAINICLGASGERTSAI